VPEEKAREEKGLLGGEGRHALGDVLATLQGLAVGDLLLDLGDFDLADFPTTLVEALTCPVRESTRYIVILTSALAFDPPRLMPLKLMPPPSPRSHGPCQPASLSNFEIGILIGAAMRPGLAMRYARRCMEALKMRKYAHETYAS
jgi:hypothetical protein